MLFPSRSALTASDRLSYRVVVRERRVSMSLAIRNLPNDTSPEAEAVLVKLWREASAARKFTVIVDTTRAMREFMLAGLRERHPEIAPGELRRAFADLWLGPELARKAYGEWPGPANRS